MSINFVKGDLFESGCMILVNAVNCKGIMGGGVALEFKKRFPKYYEDYKEACANKFIRVGEIDPYLLKENIDNDQTPKIIVSFPTKDHWKNDSKIEWIELGLKDLKGYLQNFAECLDDGTILSVAIPALGCGLGGLDWNDIKPLIEKELDNLNCEIYVYEPNQEFIW